MPFIQKHFQRYLENGNCGEETFTEAMREKVYRHADLFVITDEKYQCRFCNTTFPRNQSSMAPIENHFEYFIRNRTCGDDYEYFKKGTTAIHSTRCPFCRQIFNSTFELRVHRVEHYSVADEPGAVCNFCGHLCGDHHVLTYHKRQRHVIAYRKEQEALKTSKEMARLKRIRLRAELKDVLTNQDSFINLKKLPN